MGRSRRHQSMSKTTSTAERAVFLASQQPQQQQDHRHHSFSPLSVLQQFDDFSYSRPREKQSRSTQKIMKDSNEIHSHSSRSITTTARSITEQPIFHMELDLSPNSAFTPTGATSPTAPSATKDKTAMGRVGGVTQDGGTPTTTTSHSSSSSPPTSSSSSTSPSSPPQRHRRPRGHQRSTFQVQDIPTLPSLVGTPPPNLHHRPQRLSRSFHRRNVAIPEFDTILSQLGSDLTTVSIS